jgi:hypothetical protein
MLKAIFLLIGLTLSTIASNALEAERWGIIGSKAVQFSPSLSCTFKFGLFKNPNTCLCCVGKNYIGKKISTKEALGACLKSRFCDIKNAAIAFGISSKELQNLNTIQEQTLAHKVTTSLNLIKLIDIKKIPFQVTPIQMKKTLLLEEGNVRDIVKFLALNKLIPLSPQFLDQVCLRVDKLSEGKGYNTGQLFSIKINEACQNKQRNQDQESWKQIYILKEVGRGMEEILNLQKLKNQPKIASLMKETVSPGLPVVTKDLLNFKMQVSPKRMVYFSLIESAKGKPLSSWIKTYGETLKKGNPEVIAKTDKMMKIMFYNIGYKMSKMHQLLKVEDTKKHRYRTFLKDTIIHGDFHANNVFYDATTQKVYLIDNESMAFSFKTPLSGVHDLSYLYALTTFRTVAYKVSDQFKTNLSYGIPDDRWHQLWRNLFVGYIAAYPKEQWADVAPEVKSTFIRHLQYLKSFNVLKRMFDQRFLALLFGEPRRTPLINKMIPQMFQQVYHDLQAPERTSPKDIKAHQLLE